MKGKQHIWFFALIFLIGTAILGNSCGPTADQIEASQLKIVDSIYYRQMKSLNIEADSICESRYPALLQRAIDSIESETWEEIRRLRNEQ